MTTDGDAERVELWWEAAEAEDEDVNTHVIAVCTGLLDATGSADRSLSVVLTDDAHMALHNQQWRDVDGPTDVLSFPMDEGASPTRVPGELAPLGDIVISLDTASRQAREHDFTLLQEVTFLLVHGICHLLGHDHGEPDEAAEMRAEENRLLAAVAPGQVRPPTAY